MKNYYILGSGGFAKEVYFLAEKTLDKNYTFKGFIDKNPLKKEITVRNSTETVIDEDVFLNIVKPSEETILFMGIGNSKVIEALSQKFQSYKFPNLISKDAIFDKKSVKMGQGNIITDACVFTVDIEIGTFNIFNLAMTLGHDTKIDSFNIFNPGTNISGGVSIGNSNLLGTNSTVLQDIKIGSNNVLGAASLANRSFDNNLVMVGVPAKNIKK